MAKRKPSAAERPRKKLALKQTSAGAAGKLKICGIRASERYDGYGAGVALLELEAERPKAVWKGEPEPYAEKIRLPVPAKMAQGLHVGQLVRVEIRPA